MPSVSDTITKITGFRDLPVGWHYGKGGPISPSFIAQALGIVRQAEALGFQEMDAFPGAEGEVRVTIYQGDEYYEFTIEANGMISFVY